MFTRNLWWRWSWLALICGLTTVVWLTAGRSGAAGAPSQGATTPPATAPTTAPTTTPDAAPADSGRSTVVRRGNIEMALDFKGVFAPVKPFEVRLRIKRYHDELVVKHAVAPGTKVAKGDLLLEIDPDKIDLAIAAAENELKIAEVNLAKAEQDVRLGQQSDTLAMSDAKQHMVNAQTELKRWDDIDGGIFLLSSSVMAKVSDFYVESATDRLDQLHKMYQSEDITNQTADIVMKEATRMLDLYKIMGKVTHAMVDRYAQFEAGVRREGLTEVVNRQNVEIAELGASQTQGHELRDTSLVATRAAAAEATRNLDYLKGDRAMFSVASAIDGIVVYGNFDHKAWHPIEPRQLAPGEKIQAEQILLTVFRPGELRLEAECPEDQIAFFSPGLKVRITPLALPDIDLEGACQALPVVGEGQGPKQMFNLGFEFPKVDPRLVPGYGADVNLDAGKRQNVLIVPASAIWRSKVWTTKPVPGAKPGAEGSSIDEARAVVVGVSNGQEVEIKSGLSEGDVILTQAKHPAGQ